MTTRREGEGYGEFRLVCARWSRGVGVVGDGFADEMGGGGERPKNSGEAMSGAGETSEILRVPLVHDEQRPPSWQSQANGTPTPLPQMTPYIHPRSLHQRRGRVASNGVSLLLHRT